MLINFRIIFLDISPTLIWFYLASIRGNTLTVSDMNMLKYVWWRKTERETEIKKNTCFYLPGVRSIRKLKSHIYLEDRIRTLKWNGHTHVFICLYSMSKPRLELDVLINVYIRVYKCIKYMKIYMLILFNRSSMEILWN